MARVCPSDRSTYRPLLEGAEQALEEGAAAEEEARRVPKRGTIVQFCTATYVATEGEGRAVVDLMRDGCLEERSVVRLSTQDNSAKAGEVYRALECEVVFEPGEYHKDVEVGLVENEGWNAITEFQVNLSSPQNCELGVYLHTARVKVLDSNIFPLDKFQHAVGLDLFRGCFYHNMLFAGVLRMMVVVTLCDQLANVNFLLMMQVEMYLVNVLCNSSEEAEGQLLLPTRFQTVCLISAAYVVPALVLHVWDLVKLRMDIQGRSVLSLRASLFRKVMNYTERAHAEHGPEKVQLCLMQDTEAAASGYMEVLTLCRIVGKFLAQQYFVLMNDSRALWVVVMMPLVSISWALFRHACFQVKGRRQAYSELIHHVHEASHKGELIHSYSLRPHWSSRFMEKAEAVRVNAIPKKTFYMNTEFALKWMSPLFIGIYVAVAVPQVIRSEVSLGAFLVTLKVIKMLGEDCSDVHNLWISIDRTIAPLKRIASMLNAEVEAPAWQSCERGRRALTKELVTRIRSKGDDIEGYVSDMLPIKMEDVSYARHADVPFLVGLNIHVDQGLVVAITGCNNSGKSTFLRLLAHNIFPQSGKLLVPAHLRTLLVSRDTLLLDMGIVGNLTMGCVPGDPVDYCRVEQILRDLDLDDLVEVIQRELAQGIAGASGASSAVIGSLSNSQRNRVGLARAFIMNPEVMILQRPLAHYDKSSRVRVGQLLREHTQRKGLRLPEESWADRRMRSVFFGADSPGECSSADVVWHMRPVQLPQLDSPGAGTWTVDSLPAFSLLQHRYNQAKVQKTLSAPP